MNKLFLNIIKAIPIVIILILFNNCRKLDVKNGKLFEEYLANIDNENTKEKKFLKEYFQYKSDYYIADYLNGLIQENSFREDFFEQGKNLSATSIEICEKLSKEFLDHYRKKTYKELTEAIRKLVILNATEGYLDQSFYKFWGGESFKDLHIDFDKKFISRLMSEYSISHLNIIYLILKLAEQKKYIHVISSLLLSSYRKDEIRLFTGKNNKPLLEVKLNEIDVSQFFNKNISDSKNIIEIRKILTSNIKLNIYTKGNDLFFSFFNNDIGKKIGIRNCPLTFISDKYLNIIIKKLSFIYPLLDNDQLANTKILKNEEVKDKKLIKIMRSLEKIKILIPSEYQFRIDIINNIYCFMNDEENKLKLDFVLYKEKNIKDILKTFILKIQDITPILKVFEIPGCELEKNMNVHSYFSYPFEIYHNNLGLKIFKSFTSSYNIRLVRHLSSSNEFDIDNITSQKKVISNALRYFEENRLDDEDIMHKIKNEDKDLLVHDLNILKQTLNLFKPYYYKYKNIENEIQYTFNLLFTIKDFNQVYEKSNMFIERIYDGSIDKLLKFLSIQLDNEMSNKYRKVKDKICLEMNKHYDIIYSLFRKLLLACIIIKSEDYNKNSKTDTNLSVDELIDEYFNTGFYKFLLDNKIDINDYEKNINNMPYIILKLAEYGEKYYKLVKCFLHILNVNNQYENKIYLETNKNQGKRFEIKTKFNRIGGQYYPLYIFKNKKYSEFLNKYIDDCVSKLYEVNIASHIFMYLKRGSVFFRIESSDKKNIIKDCPIQWINTTLKSSFITNKFSPLSIILSVKAIDPSILNLDPFFNLETNRNNIVVDKSINHIRVTTNFKENKNIHFNLHFSDFPNYDLCLCKNSIKINPTTQNISYSQLKNLMEKADGLIRKLNLVLITLKTSKRFKRPSIQNS